MKRKKQIIKRIGALLCVLVMAMSVFCVHDRYLANYPTTDNFLNLERSDFETQSDYNLYGNRYTFYIYWRGVEYMCRHTSFSTSYFSGYGYCPGFGNYNEFVKQDNGLWKCVANSGSEGRIFNSLDMVYELVGLDFYDEYDYDFMYSDLPDDMIIYTSGVHRYKYSSMKEYQDFFGFVGFSPNYEELVHGKYEPTLGYLENVQRKSTYIRGALYNYDEDSLTQHWYHALTSSSGVDLTSGEYKIRHYISNATVTGYEKDDIVEMSDKYQVGEYDASKGCFSYLQKDYNEKLIELGYEELGFIDTVFKGYFTLQHHYFQIVNTYTNEVGGYLHFYPKDAKGDNFWTDYIDLGYECMDNDFVVDEDAPSGTIENIVGSGETVEDALENADTPKLGDLSGVDEVATNLEAYASQISNVTNGIGALLSEFPPWIVGLLGLSVALIFVIIVVKALRG